MELFKSLKIDLMKELSETDFSQIYEDVDILTCIKHYNEILSIIENNDTPKTEKAKLQKELHKIEKECLSKNKIVKLVGEEKTYYAYRNEVYDNSGCIVEYDFEDVLNEDDLFCEYKGDNLYEAMKKLAIKKIKKLSAEEDEY